MAPLSRFGGSADAEQTMWFLNWTPFALGHAQNPFVSNYLNHRLGINLLWNTGMPAASIVFWPLTRLWGVVMTFNVITTACLSFSAFFAFLAIRRYVRSDLAAALGGLLYGFSPAMFAQEAGHAQVVLSFVTIPVALLLIDELLIRQRLRPWLLGLFIAGLGVLQFFIFEEFFVTEIMAAVILILVMAVAHRSQVRSRLRYSLKSLSWAAGICAAALVYPVVAVQFGSIGRVHGVIHSPDIFSTDLLNPVIPTTVQLLPRMGD